MRLVALSHLPKSERIEFDVLYWVQMIVLTFLGGCLALAHDLSKEITPLVAFNLGLSVPAVVRAGAELKVSTTKGKRRVN